MSGDGGLAKQFGLLGMEDLGNGLMSAFLFLTDAAEAFPEAAEKGVVVVDLPETCMKGHKTSHNYCH